MAQEDKLNFNLFMFVALSTQAESWGYAIKGSVKQEFKQKVNGFINSARLLRSFINEHYDIDQLEDDSECFSNILELIRKCKTNEERQELYAAIRNISVSSEPSNDEAHTILP
jgi:hypothetical protein